MAVNAKDIRNIALIGHSGEGKTSLAEAILYNAGAVDRLVKVDDGKSTMDFDPEEIARKISISLAVANCSYKGTKINIIDVPGYFDFECEMLEALSVADGAVIVTSATGSMSVGTEKALEYCIEHKIPSMIFVNGVDKENSNYLATIDAIKEKFKQHVKPVIVPELAGHKLVGYANILNGKYVDLKTDAVSDSVPASLQGAVSAESEALMEAAAEVDEELMMKFLEGEPLTAEEISKGFAESVHGGAVIPVLAGSATANVGIKSLMDFVIEVMPDATNLVTHAKKGDDAITLKADDNGPIVLRIFKTIVDSIGKLSLCRVVSGTLKNGITLYNTCRGNTEKISNLCFVKGKKQEAADVASAGDIACLKLASTATGDTLADSKDIVIDPVVLPSLVYTRAVYAASKNDEAKVFDGLSRLKDEDIAFSVTKDAETGEMILAGLGDTQLDVICKKLKSKFKCEAILSDPRIAYRETIRKMAEAEGKHKKQSGGAGQYGHCWVRFEPGAADGIFEFVDAVVGGAVPRQFIPSVEKGLRDAIKHGVLAGYPMVNLKATLYDGSTHPVDGKDIAFQMAAKLAYKDGCTKAIPVLLEPIYELKITVPSSYQGDIMGDMNKRRGRIMGTDMVDGGKCLITAEVPLGEILKYATDLRSMTQGRGKYELHFVRYEEVPAQNVPKIVEEAKKLQEEE